MLNLRKAEREQESCETVMAFIRKARHTFGNANKKYFSKLLEAIENDDELGGDIQEEEEQEETPAQVSTRMLKTVFSTLYVNAYIFRIEGAATTHWR